jgi:thiol:disulfide interchange protein DsbC
MKYRLILFALGAGLYASAGLAATDPVDIAAIKETLSKSYPEVHVVDVKASPIPGLYQVFSPDAVVYVDRTAHYLIGGPLLDTRTKADLSQDALDARGAIQFSQLPLDKAIKTVRGDGSRIIAVFADPDCPFCHNLEKELAGLTDVTIYTFLYPLVSLHPQAQAKAHAIWCAPDRGAAWHDWMILDQPAASPAVACTVDPIADLLELGKTLKIDSTPVVFLENGRRVGGTRPSAQLNALMTSAHRERTSAGTTKPPSPRS